MKKIMQEVTLYRFDELDGDAQKVFQQSNGAMFDEDFKDIYEPELIRQLSDMGFETVSIQYSGFNSQGDGLSFTGKMHEKAIRPYITSAHPYLSDWMQKKGHEELLLDILPKRELRNMYVHENTVYCAPCEDSQYPEEVFAELLLLIPPVNQYRMAVCRNLYSCLEGVYNCLISTYEKAQQAEINDYWFTKDGKIFTEK